MKHKLILLFALILCVGLFGCTINSKPAPKSALTSGHNKTNQYKGISVVDIEGERLEVEQLYELRPETQWNGIEVRVHDLVAEARHQKAVTCDLYEMDDDGKQAEGKFMSLTLRQVSPESGDYSSRAYNRHEFEHGNKFIVVYKGEGLPLPVSTWYACYYH